MLVACPKKVMWNAASITETLHDMHHYGFQSAEDAISFDWGFIKKNRDKYIERLNGIYERNLLSSGVTKLIGTASLGEDANSVVYEKDGEKKTFKAKHILIATGGYPLFPPGEGIKEHSISSDEFFDLEELPQKAVVVGAGYSADIFHHGEGTPLLVPQHRSSRIAAIPSCSVVVPIAVPKLHRKWNRMSVSHKELNSLWLRLLRIPFL
jgi:hypothetical protein